MKTKTSSLGLAGFFTIMASTLEISNSVKYFFLILAAVALIRGINYYRKDFKIARLSDSIDLPK